MRVLMLTIVWVYRHQECFRISGIMVLMTIFGGINIRVLITMFCYCFCCCCFGGLTHNGVVSNNIGGLYVAGW